MNRRSFALICTLVAIIMLVTALAGCGSEESGTVPEEQEVDYADSIMVYSGAGMRKPMDEIGLLFEEQYGTKVNYNYAGSNALLSQRARPTTSRSPGIRAS